MEGAIWGSFAALFLGGADFAGRFSGRALGAPSAMFGVVAVGSALMTFIVLGGGELPPFAPAGLWLVAAHGVSTAFMGVLVIAAQAATPYYEPVQIAWMGRIVSFLTLLGYFALRRQRPNVHGRWWQFLIAQGIIDTAGYYCLFVGSRSDGVAAAVATSAFGAVTTLLAWLVLREAMGRIQWLGVILVFTGIGVLAARG